MIRGEVVGGGCKEVCVRYYFNTANLVIEDWVRPHPRTWPVGSQWVRKLSVTDGVTFEDNILLAELLNTHRLCFLQRLTLIINYHIEDVALWLTMFNYANNFTSCRTGESLGAPPLPPTNLSEGVKVGKKSRTFMDLLLAVLAFRAN